MSDLPSGFSSPATVSAMQASAANSGGDYKALVCIFLFGGADSHNMLIPTDAPGVSTLRSQYATARPVPAVGIDVAEMASTRLAPGFSRANEAEAEWALHPKLVSLAKSWYGEGFGERLAVIRNIGTLDRPISKADYNRDLRLRPDQLFAHNVQQDLWQAADVPDKPRTTGWFGRLANLIDPCFNPDARVGSAVFGTSGSPLQCFSFADKRSNILPPSMLPAGGVTGSNALQVQIARDLARDLAGSRLIDTPNDVLEAFATIRNMAVTAQANLSSGWLTLPTAPTNIDKMFNDIPGTIGTGSGAQNAIKEQMRWVARAIHSRTVTSPQFNQRRQVFFVSFGGWDHHSSLRAQHDKLTEHLSNTLNAFWSAMQAFGLTNNVTVFTESEFSRTFQSNGTGGTDHGWAGHMFVQGGAVIPGIYGPTPDYTINGARDTGSGRFIPDVSTEQMYATLLRWFGVPVELIPLVLPNISAFPQGVLDFLPAA